LLIFSFTFQIDKVFKTNKDDHFTKWDDNEKIMSKLPWLIPGNKPLKKAYNGDLLPEYREKLDKTVWNNQRVRKLKIVKNSQ
jgi:hypothetical protein